MDRFFFFLAIERDTFSILWNVNFTVFRLCPLATKYDEYSFRFTLIFLRRGTYSS